MAHAIPRRYYKLGVVIIKAKTRAERKRELREIGAKCKQWRVNQGLRLCDLCAYGISIQSIANFEYGLNDSALAMMCYYNKGYKGGD